jgi:hypothetical protein
MESIKNIKNWKVNEMSAINIIIIILFSILFSIILYLWLGPIINFALFILGIITAFFLIVIGIRYLSYKALGNNSKLGLSDTNTFIY